MKEFEKFLNRLEIRSQHTKRSYKKCVGDFLIFFEIKTLEDYNKLILGDVKNDYLPTLSNLKTSSYNQHIRSLKAFSNWLKIDGYCDKDLLQSLKLLKPRDKTGDDQYDHKRKAKKKLYLTEEELEKIIEVSKIDGKLIFALMGYMGLRRHEVIRLKISDLIDDSYLMVPGKGGTYVKMKMPPVVKYLIGEYLKIRESDSEYLVVSKVGGKKINNSHSIYERCKSAAKKANIDPEKIKYLSPHAFRRSMVCNNALRGVPDYLNMQAARHSNLNTTQIYLEALKDSKEVDEVFNHQPMPNMSVLK